MTNDDFDHVPPTTPAVQASLAPPPAPSLPSTSASASAPASAPTWAVPTRSRRRVALVGSVAGAVLAASAAVPLTWHLAEREASAEVAAVDSNADEAETETVPSAQTVRPWDIDPGLDPYGRRVAPNFEGGSSAATAAEQDASDAQSVGVVLIDTVTASGEGAGTGLILDASGTVVTNYHVVEGSTSVAVTVATTGDTFQADVVGVDPQADVAVLQLQDAADLDVVRLDDDGGTAINETVIAVGNANGQGYLSASTGTVTALEESITTAAQGSVASEDLTGLIETDTYVVGGYSGGAVLDAEGEVVGITTAASSGTAQIESYAVPIADALAVVERIATGDESGSVRIGPAAYLGVVVDDTLLVVDVEAGSAADAAGIEVGDTISAVDGTVVGDLDTLAQVLEEFEPGRQTSVRWLDSSGGAHRSSVTLGASPAA